MKQAKKCLYFMRKIDDLGRVVLPKLAREQYGICEGDSMEIICEEEQLILKKHNVGKYFKASTEKIIEGYYAVTGQPIILCDRNHILFSRGIKAACDELSDDFFEQIRRSDDKVYVNTALDAAGEIVVKELRFIIHKDECIGALVLPDNSQKPSSESIVALKVCASAIAAQIY